MQFETSAQLDAAVLARLKNAGPHTMDELCKALELEHGVNTSARLRRALKRIGAKSEGVTRGVRYSV